MNLAKLRKERNLTQKDIAKILNIQQSTYSGYESGSYEPTIATLTKLADFYNTSIDYIVGRETETINLNILDDKRSALIKEIISSTDNKVNLLSSYLDGLNQK